MVTLSSSSRSGFSHASGTGLVAECNTVPAAVMPKTQKFKGILWVMLLWPLLPI